jgi:hypothetical protein
MGYSSDIPEQYRGDADYVTRFLKDAKPGELPVQRRPNSSSSSI